MTPHDGSSIHHMDNDMGSCDPGMVNDVSQSLLNLLTFPSTMDGAETTMTSLAPSKLKTAVLWTISSICMWRCRVGIPSTRARMRLVLGERNTRMACACLVLPADLDSRSELIYLERGATMDFLERMMDGVGKVQNWYDRRDDGVFPS